MRRTPFQPYACAMKLLRDRIVVATSAPVEMLDLTALIRQWVAASGVRSGLLTVMSTHTTARVTINEREPRLQQDMVEFLQRLAPSDAIYAHNAETVDDRPNAHAHLLGLFLNASETIPVADGRLVMGDWQSIFVVELDGPRSQRELQLQIMGVE